MTAVEWHGNVAEVRDPRWSAAGNDPPPTTGQYPLPVRSSLTPCRTLARRIRRSQFAADLRDYAFVIGLLLALLVCLRLGEELHALTTALSGGTP